MQPSVAASETDPDALTTALADFVAYLIRETQQGAFELAAELDLTVSQLRTLFVLEHSDHELALSELAAQVGLSLAATGRLVDGLVRSDLVSRREDSSDRRIKRLALTAHGAETLGRLYSARREGLRGFVESLDPEARGHLARALASTPTSEQTH